MATYQTTKKNRTEAEIAAMLERARGRGKGAAASTPAPEPAAPPTRMRGKRAAPAPDKSIEKSPAAVPAPAQAIPPEFFVADFVDCAIKDDQATMEAPMFSLSTQKDMTLWTWKSSDSKKTVDVAPGYYGRATMHDKDILIFCASQIVATINAGQRPSRTVRFTAYDFLTATKRPTNGGKRGGYERMKDALNRLQGMQITTNIQTGGRRQAAGFGMIDSWEVVEKSPDDERMIAVQVTLSKWAYNAIAAKEVLTINPDYFELRKPLERRLYEIARKHVGKQKSWEIGLEALRDKCGSTVGRLRQFAGELENIIEADKLPDYLIELHEKTVLFKPRA